MKNFLLCLLLIVTGYRLLSQPIEGIYVGEVLSPGNVLLIKNKGTEVSGFVYLNAADALDLSGTLTTNLLKGTVRLADGKEVLLEAKITEDRLIITQTQDNKRERLLYKVTSKTKYNIDDLFSEEYDARLLGRWDSFKEIDADGVVYADGERFGRFSQVFKEKGRGYLKLIYLPKSVRESAPTATLDTFHDMEAGWSTHGKELTIYAPKGPIISNYAIKGDTLTITARTGHVTMYKRK